MYERLVVPQLLQVIDGVNVAFLVFGNSYSGNFSTSHYVHSPLILSAIATTPWY